MPRKLMKEMLSKENLKLKRITKVEKLREKGITLIALVVTVIILLILAGVTLNIALSENGLFERAKGGAEKYKEAQTNEEEFISDLEKEVNKYGNENPPPEKEIGSSEIASNLKEYQGKYVDLGLEVNNNSDTTDDWELFYATKDRIFLIAADYVPATNLETWGVIGNSGALKGNGFQQYSNYKYSVHWDGLKKFLSLPDLSVVMHEGYNLNEKRGNAWAVSHLLNKDAWEGIKKASSKKECIEFVTGGPTLEMWCAAWKEAVTGDDVLKPIEAEPVADEYGYYYRFGDIISKGSMYVNGTTDSAPSAPEKSKLQEYGTFFPHTETTYYCNGYWLASPHASNETFLTAICCRWGRLSYYSYFSFDLGVRPVVFLSPGESGAKLVKKGTDENKYDVVMEALD